MGSGSSEGTLNALCGGVAGAANIFTGFPFDTVKVRLQASATGAYAGPMDCLRGIMRVEGVRFTQTSCTVIALTSMLGT